MSDPIVSLKAVSHRLRARIVLLLKDDEACVCELMKVFALPQSKLSHHLLILKKTGFLKSERRGKSNYYSGMNNGINISLYEFLLSTMNNDSQVRTDKTVLVEAKKKLRHTC